ncbi:MAG: pyridine nucleotide-disulfide oxidoreductase, partial [Nocardioides sp.]|nr:pyridine nucleotide-disulfide oxidoreductase [Nocardioides sp.]
VERAVPAYGDDWWFTGLLAFVRQEQKRYEEAMELSCRSLAVEPGAGHSAHARAHAHYETGDHAAGLAWMDAWVTGEGATIESLSHFSWHAALHELSLGDLDAVRRRYDAQLRPEHGLGCRALVDSGSLLFRWALTPGAQRVPDIAAVAAVAGRDVLERPATPFLAMHAAVTLLALDDGPALGRLAAWADGHSHPTQREVVAPLARALGRMAAGHCSAAADALAALSGPVRRLGGSDAQREIVEEARIAALLRAGRLDEARRVLDERLDRRSSPRDERWRASCRQGNEPEPVGVRPG